MPTLQFIIDHKDYIKDVASKLGILENIRLTSYNNDELMLVVQYDKKLSTDELEYSRRRSLFQMWLTYKFESSFFVVSEKPREAGILEELVKNSVNIDETQKLVESFRKELKNIKFSDSYVDDEGDLKYDIPVIINLIGEDLAKYDPKKNKKITATTAEEKTESTATFFSDNKESKKTEIKNEKKRTIEEVTEIVTQHPAQFQNFLSDLPDEELQNLRKKLKASPDELVSPTTTSRIKSH